MGVLISTLRAAYQSISSALAVLRALSTEFNQALYRASIPPGLPTPLSTLPYWLNSPPFPSLINASSPALCKTVDVAIIGSGIAGAAIARSLLHEESHKPSRARKKVVILEARQLCSGATGRNGGHIKVAPYDAFARYSSVYGKERAADLVRFQLRHVQALIAVCQHEGIDIAEAREVETVDLFLDSATLDKAIDDVNEMKRWLPEVEIDILDKDRAQQKYGANSTIVGALSYQAGAIWAYRFVASIWEGLIQRFPAQLSIETNTPVECITVSQSGPVGFPYAVRTSRGTIYARHVVHATNAFASHLVPGLRNKITGARAHMSAQKPGLDFPDSAGRRSWSIVYGAGFDYVTQRPSTPEGGRGDLMIGGGFTRSLKQGIDQVGVYNDGAALDGLTVAHIAGIFPSIFHPNWGQGTSMKEVWSGIIGLTGDSLPFVGRLGTAFTGRNFQNLRGNSKNAEDSGEWIAAGWSGEGMVWAWLAGSALGIMIAGREKEELPEVAGRPGGALASWLPEELLATSKRLRSADISQLASQM